MGDRTGVAVSGSDRSDPKRAALGNEAGEYGKRSLARLIDTGCGRE